MDLRVVTGMMGHRSHRLLFPFCARHHQERAAMDRWIAPVKYFAYAVVALMLGAMAYGASMAVIYWSGIGV
jgi:hypothetical protein